jgi:hypothetical protein
MGAIVEGVDELREFNQNIDDLYASPFWKDYLYWGKYPNLPASFWFSAIGTAVVITLLVVLIKKYVK